MENSDKLIDTLIYVVIAVSIAPTVITQFTSLQLSNLSFDGGATTKDLSWLAYIGVLVFVVGIVMVVLRKSKGK